MSTNSDMEKLYKSLGLPYHPSILGVPADVKDIKVVRLDEANYSSCRGPNKEEIQPSSSFCFTLCSVHLLLKKFILLLHHLLSILPQRKD